MKVTICDKCGNEINVYPELAVAFPWVNLTFRENFDRYEQVDLCTNCQKELVKWIKNEIKNEEDDIE